MINKTGINPMGLNWRRFLVAEVDSEFAGCGQLKPHSDGTLELASIATIPTMRNQGIAGRIIRDLIKNDQRPIYLTCRSELGKFYEKFGFRVAAGNELHGYFRWLSWLAGFFMLVHVFPEPLLIMRLD